MLGAFPYSGRVALISVALSCFGSSAVSAGTLISVEQDGVQELSAKDVVGDYIDIDVVGSDLLVDGVSIAKSIKAEESSRLAADNALDRRIVAEEAARTAEDVSLDRRLVAEQSARVAEDVSLDRRLVAEQNSRIAQDNVLARDLLAEQASRIATDTALSDSIESLDDRVGVLESGLRKLDKKVARSTATAIALGGMGFLPDMKFNLAANVATYDGAQAVSVQVGYRASRNVAFTGGIASGVSGGGKAGGRVGMIFGW